MNRHIFIILIIFVIAVAGYLWFQGTELDTLQGTPTDNSTEQDMNSDESVSSDNDTELINISSPDAAASVGNPIELSGEARGQWYFEASAPVVVVDWDGRIIGESFVTAEDDWMTEDFVSFSGSIAYDLPDDSYSASGTVIFRRANPSGLPENDAAVEVPVVLK